MLVKALHSLLIKQTLLTTKYCLIWRYSLEALQAPARPSSVFVQIKYQLNSPGKLLSQQQALVRGSVSVLAPISNSSLLFHLHHFSVLQFENLICVISH